MVWNACRQTAALGCIQNMLWVHVFWINQTVDFGGTGSLVQGQALQLWQELYALGDHVARGGSFEVGSVTPKAIEPIHVVNEAQRYLRL